MELSAKHVLGLTCVALLAACANRDSVELGVDFTARDTWAYDFALSVGGRVTMGDSVSSYSNRLRCRLTGRGDSTDPSLVHVTTDSVSVETGLNEGESDELRRLLESFEISFSLREGIVGLGDSATIPIVKVGRRDLYRYFVKMLPLLPQGLVRPGFTWERQMDIPLTSQDGDGALWHLYESFRFDSLASVGTGGRKAYVSWLFSYAADAGSADTGGLPDDTPSRGRGTGNAVLDVDRKMLEEAGVESIVPESPASDVFSIEWEEKASIRLAD
jgi:hypothetical protein